MAGLHCQENVFAAIAAVAAETPDKVAVIGATRQLTFGTLVTRAHALAASVAETPPGAVAIIVPPGPDLAIALTACMAAGRVAIVLSAAAPDQRNRVILREAGAASAIVPAPAPAIAPGIATIAMTAIPDTPAAPCRAWRSVGDADPAVVAFTSGSTGIPKGVVRSHARIFRQIEGERRRDHRRADDIAVSLADPATGMGLTSLVTNLVAGTPQVLVPAGELGLTPLLRLLERCAPTRLTAVPQLLAVLLNRQGARAACASLRLVIARGDALLAADLDILRRALPAACRICTSYGLTETSSIAQQMIPPDYLCPTARVPAGRAAPGVVITIRDESGATLPAGAVGEIWASGQQFGMGHWRHGRVIRTEFPADPDDPTRRIFRTGDVGRLDADGMLHVLGRRDRQVKINGVRIDPAELENAIRRAPGIVDAAVLTQAGERGAVLIACVVAAAPAHADIVPALRERLRAALPAAMLPSRIVRVDRLPRIGSGKIDSGALEAIAAAPVPA